MGSEKIQMHVEDDPRPLRWHKCIECGWEDLMPVGSKPWTCSLCLRDKGKKDL